MNHPLHANPFPPEDRDRHAIWDMLVSRDFEAFVTCDWSRVESDFLADEFFAIDAGRCANPDHWTVRFATLAAYRDAWLEQAEAFGRMELVGETKLDFLHRITRMRDIEIVGDRAVARKKFDGEAQSTAGEPVTVKWQTLYQLRHDGQRWRIVGFIGYLPNPMGGAAATAPTHPRIALPEGVSQHKKAGPYSPVLRIEAGPTIAISGQGPLDDDGNVVGTTIAEQARVTLAQCQRQLAAAGASLDDVYKVMVYLGDMAEWGAFNEVYREHFNPPYPVRTAVECRLWGGIKVEIDMLAAAPA